jgi:hypothetical protein
MATTALDMHQTVKDLTAAGFTDSQAEALTQALRQVQQIDLSDFTTKADLAELRNELKLEFAAVRREMAEIKTELIKWILGIGFVQVAMILAVLKLLPPGHP